MLRVSGLLAVVLSCGSPAVAPEPGPPEAYAFESRFDPGVSSVVYGDRVLHHVTIRDIVELAGVLTFRIDDGEPAAGIAARFERLFAMDAKVLAGESIALSTSPPTIQQAYGDLSKTGQSLASLAAHHPGVDHEDWDTQLVGFGDAARFRHSPARSPADLIRAIFVTLEHNATDRSMGIPRLTPFEGAELTVHFTKDGLDLQQLLDGILHSVILFRHAADQYADEELDRSGECVRPSGLCADNTTRLEDAPQTPLEREWDRAFGSFGAAIHYGSLSPRTLSRRRFQDHSGDGRIDLAAEYNFKAAVTAALREEASSVSTNLHGRVWDGFRTGRFVISRANGALLEGELEALRTARDDALWAWEESIAATVVHHINDALDQVCICGDEDYEYQDAAFFEHGTTWSALKASAIALQLNPRSPMTRTDVETLHSLIGDKPVHWEVGVNDEEVEMYRVSLRAAREILAGAYGFDRENLGDEDGNGGW